MYKVLRNSLFPFIFTILSPFSPLKPHFLSTHSHSNQPLPFGLAGGLKGNRRRRLKPKLETQFVRWGGVWLVMGTTNACGRRGGRRRGEVVEQCTTAKGFWHRQSCYIYLYLYVHLRYKIPLWKYVLGIKVICNGTLQKI